MCLNKIHFTTNIIDELCDAFFDDLKKIMIQRFCFSSLKKSLNLTFTTDSLENVTRMVALPGSYQIRKLAFIIITMIITLM